MMNMDALQRPDNYYETLAGKYRAQTTVRRPAAGRRSTGPSWIVVGDAAKWSPGKSNRSSRRGALTADHWEAQFGSLRAHDPSSCRVALHPCRRCGRAQDRRPARPEAQPATIFHRHVPQKFADPGGKRRSREYAVRIVTLPRPRSSSAAVVYAWRSLTTGPDWLLKNSTVRTPIWRALPRSAARPHAPEPVATGSLHGAVERRRMPSRCSFSGESHKACRPSAQRATITENSAVKSIPDSATAGSSAIAFHAASVSPGKRIHACPFPS